MPKGFILERFGYRVKINNNFIIIIKLNENKEGKFDLETVYLDEGMYINCLNVDRKTFTINIKKDKESFNDMFMVKHLTKIEISHLQDYCK